MDTIYIYDNVVRSIPLPAAPLVFGRSRRADVRIHDSLLSRKHCTIVPGASTLRLIDLKSVNGSFVNGRRVERSDLARDDVIEIGNTVLLVVTSRPWTRRSGFDDMRNPGKVLELVRRVTLKNTGGNGGASTEASRPLSAPVEGATVEETAVDPEQGSVGRDELERPLAAARDALIRWAAAGSLRDQPMAVALFERYLFDRVVAMVVRGSPQLREMISDAKERVLLKHDSDCDLDALRHAVREALRESAVAAGILHSTTRSDSSSAQSSSGKE